ncbi:MAG TPA: hypothetical protein VFA97_03670, partial [Gaiellaceae bacterium]|nr:hypothetical protein [Gaiellaceae bacterium]
MLGRRAAVAAGAVVLAVTGGGVALAASHNSSPSSKPATHATPKQHSAPRSMQRSHSGHCPNMG